MAGDVYVSFGADTGELEGAFALARAQTQGLSKEINSLAREMRSAGASADSDLGQRLNVLGNELAQAKSHTAELSAEMRAHRAVASGTSEEVAGLLAHFRQLTEGLTGLHEAFSSASEAFAAAFAVHEILEWVNATQEAAEKIERLSHQLGASTDDVQKIGSVAVITGTDFERMGTSLERMQLRLRESASASNPTQAALKALGIDAKAFVDLPIPEQLDRLAEAFSSFADGPTKTAAAMAILGRAGADLIPALDRGKEGFNELEDAAKSAGAVLSEQDVKALAEAKEQSALLGLSLTGLSRDIQATFNPAISSSTSLLTKFVSVIDLAIRGVKEWGAIITEEGAAEGGLAPPGGANARLLEEAASIPTDLGGNVTVNKKRQVPDFTSGRSGGGGKGKADHTAERDAEESYREQIDAAKRAAEATIESLDSEVREHKISWQRWAKDSVAALETEKAAVIAANAQAQASTALSSLEKRRIANEEANEIAEINKKEVADQTKAVQEEARQWQAALGTVVSSINSQLKSVLSGAESWKSAMVNIFEEFATKAIEYLEKVAVEEIAVKLVSAGLGIPSFAVGAWELPGDTLAQVHKGEMIVPAAQADGLRAALGGAPGAPASSGGGNVSIHPQTHFHVSAIDGAGVSSFFRQNGAGMARSLDQAVRHGAALGLKRLNGRN